LREWLVLVMTIQAIICYTHLTLAGLMG
jgi:hypothetical protein